MEGPRADPAHVLVVGAGSEVGSAVARRFAGGGTRLTLADAGSLDALADALCEDGAEVSTVVADAASAHDLRAALAPRLAADPPGVVVYDGSSPASASDPGGADDADAVNVVGAIVCAQLAVPPMRVAHAGTVLFVGTEPDPGSGTLALGARTLRAVAALLSEQLGDGGVHVAHVAVDGASVAAIAETCWELSRGSRERWRAGYRVGA